MSIDEDIGAAGSRLASAPVATPDLERLVRRRSRRLRATAVAGCLVVISLGIGALVSNDSRQQPTTEPAAATDSSAADAGIGQYELALEGARPLPVESLVAGGTDAVVWYDESTGTYLWLVVRPGVAASIQAPTGVGPMVEDTSFPSTQGRAWFTDTQNADTRQMRMWWSRPNGDLWLLEMFWYGTDAMNVSEGRGELRSRALAISVSEPSDQLPGYELADPAMGILAVERAGDVESRSQVWNYQHGSLTGKITLLSLQGSEASGRANLLARGKPETVRIDEHDAWQVTDSSTGETMIGWQTDEARGAWITLSIPAGLASLTPEVRAALRSS
jgi:hypothetical protein